MAMTMTVLGKPGEDNALYLKVDSGQSNSKLLFDCGENCLDEISCSEIQAIDHLFFSHHHMDHIAGFDHYFRANYARVSKPNHIWGPPGTAEIMSHRFQGYWWNLNGSMDASWFVHDIHPDRIETQRFELREAFAQSHVFKSERHEGTIVEFDQFHVSVFILDHHGPCIAYKVSEKPRCNIDTSRMSKLGLRPGPWLQDLKNLSITGTIEVNGCSHDMTTLREALLVSVDGDSVAYVTDFRVDDAGADVLAEWLRGCGRVLCEAQYIDTDMELAIRHNHMTTKRVGMLAAKADIGELILFHLSRRYQTLEWNLMLEECQTEFPGARFPHEWIFKE